MNVLKKLTGYKQNLEKPEIRPKAVLLDVNGTLFSPAAAAPAFKELGLDESLIELWFARVLRDGFAAQAAGVFRPFKEIGAYHLEVMLREAGKEEWSRMTGVEAMGKVMDAWSKAPLYPDIPDVLRHLNNAGIKVCVLTNGSAEGIAKAVLTSGQVMQLVKGPMLDIAMAQAWKPFANSYSYAVKHTGVAADRVAMVASHPWDIVGAMQAGLRGIYVQRNPSEAWPDYLPAPDAIVEDFSGLVELLGIKPAAAVTGPSAAAGAADTGSPTKK